MFLNGRASKLIMGGKIEWYISRNRYIPCVLPILTYWSFPLSYYFPVPDLMAVNIWNRGDYIVFKPKESIEQVSQYAVDYLLAHKNNFKKVRKDAIVTGKHVISLSSSFAKKVPQASYEEVLDFLNQLELKHNLFTRKSMLLWMYTSVKLVPLIQEQLKQYSALEQEQIMHVMSLPTIRSYSDIEEDIFGKIVDSARKKGVDSPVVKNKIKSFAKKYFWFPFEYVGPTIWNEETIKKRIIEALEKPSQTCHRMDAAVLAQQKIIKKHHLSRRAMDLFAVLRFITILQDDRKMINCQICYHLNGVILNTLASRLDITLSQAYYLDLSLFKEFVKNKEYASLRREVAEREKLCVFIQNGTYLECYTGERATHMLAQLKIDWQPVLTQIKEIKGQGVSRGKAIGKVLIIKTSNALTNLPDQTVLVTGMTTPDFVPLMKQAVAIVTDEGGITSHAAITSRELHKPCIVGTKIATKVLKDGDLVEIDANKGIVKILKRK